MSTAVTATMDRRAAIMVAWAAKCAAYQVAEREMYPDRIVRAQRRLAKNRNAPEGWLNSFLQDVNLSLKDASDNRTRAEFKRAVESLYRKKISPEMATKKLKRAFWQYAWLSRDAEQFVNRVQWEARRGRRVLWD